jgi:predicted protein tyrosine phosphatase
MKTVVCGVLELPQVNSNNQFTHILSLQDPPETMQEQARHARLLAMLEKTGAEVTSLLFRDVRGRMNTSCASPDEDDINAICRFAEGLGEEDSALVHCTTGVSRSTAALAIVYMCRDEGLSEQDACEKVRRQREISRPNERMLWLYGRRSVMVDGRVL